MVKQNLYPRVTILAGLPDYNFANQEMPHILSIAKKIKDLWSIDCGIYFGKGTWQNEIENCIRFECILLNHTIGATIEHDIEYLTCALRHEFQQLQVLVIYDEVAVSLYPARI